MNRRQFLKRIGVACVTVVAVPVTLLQKKDRFVIGSCDNYIKRKNGIIDKFNTRIVRLKNIADEALIIYTEDEVWMLKDELLTKLGPYN